MLPARLALEEREHGMAVRWRRIRERAKEQGRAVFTRGAGCCRYNRDVSEALSKERDGILQDHHQLAVCIFCGRWLAFLDGLEHSGLSLYRLFCGFSERYSHGFPGIPYDKSGNKKKYDRERPKSATLCYPLCLPLPPHHATLWIVPFCSLRLTPVSRARVTR